jgi:cation:H+ antiporter
VHPVVSLLSGLGLAAFGGELFVRGVVGLAAWTRVPAGIAGATLAAFATSSPELTVAINAAGAGMTGVSFGDALGSNVLNVGLVLGVSLLLGPIKESGQRMRRDFPVALACPLVTGALVLDGDMSRWDAAVLLVVFATWLALNVLHAMRHRDATVDTLGEKVGSRAVFECAVGLVALLTAGRLIVDGAVFVGQALGWSPMVVGATLVALGTSSPELATTVVSRLKGHDEVGLGTVLGSNIFNNLFIVGVATSIHPFRAPLQSSFIVLAAGFLVLLACFPQRDGAIPRWRGWGLIALYAASTALLIATSPADGTADR